LQAASPHKWPWQTASRATSDTNRHDAGVAPPQRDAEMQAFVKNSKWEMANSHRNVEAQASSPGEERDEWK